MADLLVATKSMRSRADLQDYIAGFNNDDAERYCAYYAKNIFVDIGSLSNKTLAGYLEWIKPLHARVSETLNLQKCAVDKDGRFVVAEFLTKFRGLGKYHTDNFADKWGPVFPGDGPVVKMTAWYHLDDEGHICRLEVDSKLLESAVPPPGQ